MWWVYIANLQAANNSSDNSNNNNQKKGYNYTALCIHRPFTRRAVSSLFPFYITWIVCFFCFFLLLGPSICWWIFIDYICLFVICLQSLFPLIKSLSMAFIECSPINDGPLWCHQIIPPHFSIGANATNGDLFIEKKRGRCWKGPTVQGARVPFLLSSNVINVAIIPHR